MKLVLKEWRYIVGLMLGVSIVISGFVVIQYGVILGMALGAIGTLMIVCFGSLLQDFCDLKQQHENTRVEEQFTALVRRNFAADYLRSKSAEVLLLESLNSSRVPDENETTPHDTSNNHGLSLPKLVVGSLVVVFVVIAIAIVMNVTLT